jgi:hypothetical protein
MLDRRNFFARLAGLFAGGAAAKQAPAIPVIELRLEEFEFVEDVHNHYGEIVAGYYRRMKQAIDYQRSLPLTRVPRRAGRVNDNCGPPDPNRGRGDRDPRAGA